MMQQQTAEQNQMGVQQQQQMVLCPVRVVYETQMLMQPGEQMQPNQTIFINPQNPPPWAQNRQVQNQVIYVQQVPGNYMPSIQQHMDPNQLYFQQAYQQIIQQPMIAQGQDMRQYQVNMMPSNMVQNIQTVSQHVPNQVVQQSERNESNYIQVQHNVGPNTQISNVNQQQVAKQQNVNVQAIQNNAQAMQNQQMVNQRQVYLNTGQQSSQHPNMARPQLITVNPMQQTNVQPTINQAQGNNIPTNAQVMPPMFVNNMNNAQVVNAMAQTEARMRKIPTNVNQMPTNIRNVAPNYVYRPIQPRPQYRAHMPNVSVQNTIPQSQNVMNLQPMQPINQQVRPTHDESKSRKRKSESPDELNKKLTIVNINTAMPQNPIRVAQTPIPNPVKSVEIGVNTSPIHRPRIPATCSTMPRISATTTTAPRIPATTLSTPKTSEATTPMTDPKITSKKIEETKLKEEAIKPNNVNPEIVKEIKTKTETDTSATDKIRYTVFPQARTRAPKDEFNKVNINILKDTKNILYTDEKNEIKLESKNLLKEKILSRTEIKKESEGTEDSNVKKEEVKETKQESAKEVRDYVLTHVLDGIVIQESNTAFPIREPTRVVQASIEKKREVVKVDSMLKGGCLELPISDLKLKEEDKAKEDNDNPFVDLKTATVKSWTVDDLCAHLTKYKWDETVSLLQEHEIDGESLFLVTKPQLLHIGVKEKYADLICDFVKS